jgi:hypothetical protein
VKNLVLEYLRIVIIWVGGGGWLVVAGCWLVVAGCWLVVAGCWLVVVGGLSLLRSI